MYSNTTTIPFPSAPAPRFPVTIGSEGTKFADPAGQGGGSDGWHVFGRRLVKTSYEEGVW
jgi:hypothetical protein